MSFARHTEQQQGVQLLQRSLRRGRLAHAYLFVGVDLAGLETVARTLAKTLNCPNPVRMDGVAVDCCDACPACHKIDNENHGDVFWVRPGSKLRQIRIGQITRRPTSPPRVLLEVVHLKPTEAEYKVCIVVAADRMNEDAANAFLKTLEEPPPKSVLILLSTEPQRILETIRSRCLRLVFAGEGEGRMAPGQMAWLGDFSRVAVDAQSSLLSRYRLLGSLLGRLARTKAEIEESLSARSPLGRYEDADPGLREKWEEELTAAVEAEYRRQRADALASLQWWLRDVWLQTQKAEKGLLRLPELHDSVATVAGRVSTEDAAENLNILEQTRRLLDSNVQEALALEVGMLKLRL